ncbi:MAG: hypothetical protein U1E45_06695 [Geminicoccaceae bacterium]
MRARTLTMAAVAALLALPGGSRAETTDTVPPISQTALVAFGALLTPQGPEVDLPLSWQVARPDGTPPDNVVYTGGGINIITTLPAGRYVATAEAQNVKGTADITVEAGKDGIRDVVLDAGVLSLGVVPASGKEEPVDAPEPSWTIQPQAGQGAVDPLQSAAPRLILAAGPYSIQARSGPLAATTSLTLAPGAIESRTLDFRAGQVRLEAAMAKDGPALRSWSDPSWQVVAVDVPGLAAGESVQQLDKASATTILSAGRYRAIAKVLGVELSTEVTAVEKEQNLARVVVPSATLALALPPATSTAGLAWTVTAVDALGVDAGTKVADAVKTPSPSLTLAPGVWSVTLAHDGTTISREVTLSPGQTATEQFDLKAGG